MRGAAKLALAPSLSTTAPLSSAPATTWKALFGCPAPQRLASLVEQAVAWREQVLVHGDISAATAHDLRLAAEHALQQRGGAPAVQPPSAGSATIAPANVDPATTAGTAATSEPPSSSPTRASRTGQRANAAPLPPATSQLLPGSQLVKAYGGRNHVVTVEADGFRYEGTLFASLSAVAKHITGTHWNGLLFFGLRKRRSYPPKPRNNG